MCVEIADVSPDRLSALTCTGALPAGACPSRRCPFRQPARAENFETGNEMTNDPTPDLAIEPVLISPAISQLSHREADRLLVEAEAARRAEIADYWAQCRTGMVRAAQLPAGSPPLLLELCLLADCTSRRLPGAGEIGSLFQATERLLAVRRVRDSLIGEYATPPQAEQIDGFWDDSLVVALKVVERVPVMVLRYSGPLFNQGTLPEDALSAGQDWFVLCHREDDGSGGAFEYLTAYVIGTLGADGVSRNAALNLESRSALMRDLPAMEALVDWDQLGDELAGRPLAAFPSTTISLIAQLNAHKAALRAAGAIAPAWQAIVEERTAALHRRIDRLRSRMRRVEDGIHQLRARVREEEAGALEEETGFSSGTRVRHTATGEEGVLEIVYFGTAQFRLCETTMYVTEDIRRGEWERVPDAADGAP